MSRYYLMIPKTTFDAIHPTITAADGTETVNPDYNTDLAERLQRFTRIHSKDFDRIQPKSLDGSIALVEIDFDGSQYDPETDFTTEEKTQVVDTSGNIIPIEAEHLKLNKYKDTGVITDFGIWKSPDENSYPTIAAVMGNHAADWVEPAVI